MADDQPKRRPDHENEIPEGYFKRQYQTDEQRAKLRSNQKHFSWRGFRDFGGPFLDVLLQFATEIWGLPILMLLLIPFALVFFVAWLLNLI